MKFVTLFLLLISICSAQLTTWKGFTSSGYVYYGFNGGGQPGSPGASGPNTFTTATSTDGLSWKNYGGDWSDYLSGTPFSGILNPYQINAPDAIWINGGLYLHVASANDDNETVGTWIVGKADVATGHVTTLASINWTSPLSGLHVCFAGGWVRNADMSVYIDGSGFVHLQVPCSISNNSSFIIYDTHSLATDLISWSSPVSVNVGQSNTYDPQTYLIGGTFYMWCKDATNAFITLASSSSVTGPYTMVFTGDWAGWGSGLEGPFAYLNPASNGWIIMFEAFASTHVMYYSTCSTLNFTTCTWTTKTPWTEDSLYRHGSIIKIQ